MWKDEVEECLRGAKVRVIELCSRDLRTSILTPYLIRHFAYSQVWRPKKDKKKKKKKKKKKGGGGGGFDDIEGVD